MKQSQIYPTAFKIRATWNANVDGPDLLGDASSGLSRTILAPSATQCWSDIEIPSIHIFIGRSTLPFFCPSQACLSWNNFQKYFLTWQGHSSGQDLGWVWLWAPHRKYICIISPKMRLTPSVNLKTQYCVWLKPLLGCLTNLWHYFIAHPLRFLYIVYYWYIHPIVRYFCLVSYRSTTIHGLVIWNAFNGD